MVDISYLGYGVEEPSGAEREGLLDAPYFPFDGLNEHGLAIGIMAVSDADGGEDPDKVTIGSRQGKRGIDAEWSVDPCEGFGTPRQPQDRPSQGSELDVRTGYELNECLMCPQELCDILVAGAHAFSGYRARRIGVKVSPWWGKRS
jgi:hypothetical protein